MAIDKVKFPNGNTENIQDSRIPGVDSTPTANSANLVTSGGVKSALSGYLPLSGGTLTGPLSFNGISALPQKSLIYIVGIDAFANGGQMGWQMKSDFLSGYLPLTGGTITGRLTMASRINMNNEVIEMGSGMLGAYTSSLPTVLFWHDGSNWQKVWHAGNSNLSSVDWTAGALGLATTSGSWNTTLSEGKLRFLANRGTVPEGSPGAWYSGVSIMTGYTGFQLASYGGADSVLKFRNITDGGVWRDWKSVAFTDSNVSSASKLETARKLWGQSFDGTADVSGILTGVNSDNTTGIGTAIAIGCPSVDGLSATGNGVGITMGISGESYYTKIATVFEDSNPRYLQPALAFYTMYNSHQAGSEVERMRISANGNVGIGTPSPAYKLDVNGILSATAGLFGGDNGVNIGATYAGSPSGAYDVIERARQGGTLYFQYNHAGSISMCQGGGNVGIGTSFPAAKLDVNGDIRGTSVTTTLQTSQPSGGMLPNREYKLGTLSSATTFTLAAETSGVTNHYFWTFETGSTAPTITWPAAITSWAGGSAPSINSNRHYEVSVLNGVAVVLEV